MHKSNPNSSHLYLELLYKIESNFSSIKISGSPYVGFVITAMSVCMFSEFISNTKILNLSEIITSRFAGTFERNKNLIKKNSL